MGGLFRRGNDRRSQPRHRTADSCGRQRLRRGFTYKKVQQLKNLIEFSDASTLIEIDGGVTDKNANKLVEVGADVLVAGSFVFKSEDPTSTIKDLKAIIN